MLTEDLSFFEEEEFKKNLSLYEQMTQGGRSVYLEADELTDIAEYYLIKNDKESALQCIDYALRLHPDSVDPMIFLARQKMFNGDIKGAKAIRDSITDQNDREVIFLNAELMLREGEEDRVHNYLRQQSRQEEKEDLAMFAYDCACLFADYGLWNLAATWNDTASAFEPRNEKILKLKAEIQLATNHVQDAIKTLNGILDENPYNLSAWHTLSEAYFADDDLNKTLEAADFALAIDEHDEHGMLMKANCYFHLQRYEEAHRYYRTYLNEYPQQANEMAHLFDGLCLIVLDRNEEALEQLLRAEELTNGTAKELQYIYRNIISTYSHLDMPDKALEYVDKINAMSPDYEAYLEKAELLIRHHRKEEGLACYDRFIQGSDNDIMGHFLVGVSLLECIEPEEAHKHFRYILNHKAEVAETNDKTDACIAFSALALCEFKDFLYYLERACRQDLEFLKSVMGRYIPEETEPRDYYSYALTHLDKLFDADSDLNDFLKKQQ